MSLFPRLYLVHEDPREFVRVSDVGPIARYTNLATQMYGSDIRTVDDLVFRVSSSGLATSPSTYKERYNIVRSIAKTGIDGKIYPFQASLTITSPGGAAITADDFLEVVGDIARLITNYGDADLPAGADIASPMTQAFGIIVRTRQL